MSDGAWKSSGVIPDVLIADVTVGTDARGSGRRVTDVPGLLRAGITWHPTDAFILRSHRDVLRGMHAQAKGGKTVTCLAGKILEVVLDLRTGSPTCGRFQAFELSGGVARNLYLPAGVAHAFLTLSESSDVLIQSESVPGDVGFGVRWDSFGFVWPCESPIVSERDSGFPTFTRSFTPPVMLFPIVLSSAGRRVALMRKFAESAGTLGLEPKIVVTEMNPQCSAACHLSDSVYPVSRCTASEYFGQLLDMVRRESPRLIVPTIDTELAGLASAKDRLKDAGVHVVISSPEVVALARDKVAFIRFCESHSVLSPRTVSAVDFLAGNHNLSFPLIFKPITGSRSIGIVRALTPAEIPRLEHPADYMVQELWVGREFTVNLFFGRDGLLKCVIPYERLEVRDGEVSKGATRRIPAILDVGAKIGAELAKIGAYGPLCFQGILRADGVFAVFELNARFGGGYPLAHDAGATFTRWLIEDALGLPSTAHDNWKSDRLMLRYDDAVFVDEA